MVSSHFTTIQNLMSGCAALEAGLIFTLPNREPKSREARHLRAAAIGVPRRIGRGLIHSALAASGLITPDAWISAAPAASVQWNRVPELWTTSSATSATPFAAVPASSPFPRVAMLTAAMAMLPAPALAPLSAT